MVTFARGGVIRSYPAMGLIDTSPRTTSWPTVPCFPPWLYPISD
jgi:hypothetical protein